MKKTFGLFGLLFDGSAPFYFAVASNLALNLTIFVLYMITKYLQKQSSNLKSHFRGWPRDSLKEFLKKYLWMAYRKQQCLEHILFNSS